MTLQNLLAIHKLQAFTARGGAHDRNAKVFNRQHTTTFCQLTKLCQNMSNERSN